MSINVIIDSRTKSDILTTVQAELVPWTLKNFGARDHWMPVMGLAEEVGELSHSFLKRAQGIRTTEDHDANIRDALGDILIYACDVANMEGINLSEILSTVWSSVSKRDWTKEPTP